MVSPRVFWNIFLLYFFPFSFNLDRGYSTFAPPDASPHEYHLLSAFMAHKAFVCWYCHLLESFLSLSRIAPDSNKAIHNGQMAFSFSNHPWVKNEFRIHTAKNNNIRVSTRPWTLFFKQPSQLKKTLYRPPHSIFFMNTNIIAHIKSRTYPLLLWNSWLCSSELVRKFLLIFIIILNIDKMLHCTRLCSISVCWKLPTWHSRGGCDYWSDHSL